MAPATAAAAAAPPPPPPAVSPAALARLGFRHSASASIAPDLIITLRGATAALMVAQGAADVEAPGFGKRCALCRVAPSLARCCAHSHAVVWAPMHANTTLLPPHAHLFP